MNLLCPHCQKMLTILDQFAGQLVKCPLCGSNFTAPTLAPATVVGATSGGPPASPATTDGPTVSPPPAKEDVYSIAGPMPDTPRYPLPPAEEPHAAPQPRPGPPPTMASSAAPPSPPQLPTSYARTATLWISPRVVPWIAPMGLVIVFVLLFFTWLAGPYDSWNQSGWGSGFGQHNSLLGIFYLFFYLLAFLVMVASVVVDRMSMNLPLAVRQLWPWRAAIYGGLGLLAFVFLVLELLVGFGAEQVQAPVQLLFTAQKDLGPLTVTYADLVHRTVLLWLAVLCHLAAVVGALLDVCLHLRKNRPLPRIDIAW